MPIYEYRCDECGFQDEFLQKASEPPLSVCPSCGKPSFRKQLSAAGFQLKGSGWYATDFRNSGAKPAKGGDARGDTKESAASEGAAKEGGAKEGGAKPEAKDAKPSKTESSAVD